MVGTVSRDAATAEFFDGTARGELLLRRCPEGHLSTPYAEACETCAAADLTAVPAAGGGTVVSHAVSHKRDGTTLPLVIVELDEGPWWWSCLVGAEPGQVTTGARVRLTFERPEGSEAVPVFRPADA
ncbi:OB-fold domain-containing protein [Pseudonocardia sp. RS11V-5]|uniref:Zn-ribbon domain-containing OB-fold protein n=1 Tax=Pseudonocardia terrae TaxID=2905831 RepID=UPI001E439BAA|nr:OB-fold domain-containing protein [Pseudonocardia terrae]MCE3553662.1 OB-fold domain-containing protein [Pseudonocardia terrae]